MFVITFPSCSPNSPNSLLLQFSPDSLHIAENSKEHQVTVHSTVPIPCYDPDHGHQCGVPLALSVHDPGQTCRETGVINLVFSYLWWGRLIHINHNVNLKLSGLGQHFFFRNLGYIFLSLHKSDCQRPKINFHHVFRYKMFYKSSCGSYMNKAPSENLQDIGRNKTVKFRVCKCSWSKDFWLRVWEKNNLFGKMMFYLHHHWTMIFKTQIRETENWDVLRSF